jgi:hypothetical protein
MAEVQAKEDKQRANEAKRQAAEDARDENRQDEARYRAARQVYEANQKAFHASEEALKRLMALQDHLGRQAVEEAHREEEARKHGVVAIHRLSEALGKQAEQQVRNAEALGKHASRQIADIERLGNEQERAALRGRAEARQRAEEQHSDAVKAIQDANAQAQAIAALKGDYKAMADAAIAAYTAMGQANANYLKQLAELMEKEKEAKEAETEGTEAKIQGMAAEIGTFVGSIAGRKAEAEVEGGFYLAEGAFDLARGIWPPNPALIARGLGEIGAGINMLKVAGKSGSSPTSVGGGGHGGDYQSRDSHGGGYGGGGGYSEREEAASGTGLAPGAQGSPGGRLNVYILNESEQARFFADGVNRADAAGHFMQVSTARRSAPAQG